MPLNTSAIFSVSLSGDVYKRQELEYIDENIDMVGVNNRKLGSFHTEVENSFRLAEKLPEEMLRISERCV